MDERLNSGEREPETSVDEEVSIGEMPTLKNWGLQGDWGGRRWKEGEKILDRYLVEKELGQGGMGVVYGCMDLVGGVRVAVKALPPELSHNSAEMEEVRDNFQLVGELRHPNIAGVRTLEKDGRGEYYLVMDIAEGESLRRWMKKKSGAVAGGTGGGAGIPLREVVDVLRQVASALDYAHGERVMHRDIKPGNVMIDGQGRVKVLDFGLAAQIRSSMSRVSLETWRTSGTRMYMAPEQWEGKRQGAKTDQYALGAMAYEMLSGRLPFEGDDPEVLRGAVLHGETEEISGLPPKSMKALRRALAKLPEERFATCGEFVEALAGNRSGAGTSGKGKLAWIVAAVAVPVLALAAGAAWWAWSVAEKLRQESALEIEVAELAGETKERVLETQGKGYDPGQGFREKLGKMQTALQEGEAALERKDFAEAKESFAAALSQMQWLEDNAPLRDEAARERELAEAAKVTADAANGGGEEDYGKGNAAMSRADAAFERGDFKSAEVDWKSAAAFYRKAKTAASEKATEEEARLARETAEKAAEAAAERERQARTAVEKAAAEKAAEQARLAAVREAANKAAQEQAERETAEAQRRARDAERRAQEAEAARKAAEAARQKAEPEAAQRQRELDAQRTKPDEQPVPPVAVIPAAGSVASPSTEGGHAGETKTMPLPGGVAMDMVWCPAGRFTMGSPEGESGRSRNETPHPVTLTRGFWIGKFEVTQGQWKNVMGNNPSPGGQCDDCPVQCVSWKDCQDFCRTLGPGWRLPTEAEWEYACRAGSTGPYGGSQDPSDLGWFATMEMFRPLMRIGTAFGSVREVGTKAPNAWGLHDMHGNVAEWCQDAFINDWYDDALAQGITSDLVAPEKSSARCVRGGSFMSRVQHCRSACRDSSGEDVRTKDCGVRLVYQEALPER